MKKKIIIIAIVIIVISICCTILIIPECRGGKLRGEIFTDRIEDYNTNECPVNPFVFPAEIPSNAQVISFCYYNYWDEERDTYLELKFDTAEEMESYLNEAKSECIAMCQSKFAFKDKEWIIETQNIYNHSYTDMICTAYTSYSNGKNYVGYRIEPRGDKTLYYCDFDVISYSYDELTVIHSSTGGWYSSKTNEHLPEYFTRFDVPDQDNHERLFYLD